LGCLAAFEMGKSAQHPKHFESFDQISITSRNEVWISRLGVDMEDERVTLLLNRRQSVAFGSASN